MDNTGRLEYSGNRQANTSWLLRTCVVVGEAGYTRTQQYAFSSVGAVDFVMRDPALRVVVRSSEAHMVPGIKTKCCELKVSGAKK